jgi:hypothetical protein
MANTNNMIYVAQYKLQQLIRQNTRSVRKSKQRMIREHSAQPHRPRMQDSLMAETAQAGVTMYNGDLFSNEDVSEDGKQEKTVGKVVAR